jgi:hypothetical protein
MRTLKNFNPKKLFSTISFKMAERELWKWKNKFCSSSSKSKTLIITRVACLQLLIKALGLNKKSLNLGNYFRGKKLKAKTQFRS